MEEPESNPGRLGRLVSGLVLAAATGCAAEPAPEPPLGLIPERLSEAHAEALLKGSALAPRGESVSVISHSPAAEGHLLLVDVASQRQALVYLPRVGRPAWLTGPFDPSALLKGIVRLR